MPSGGNLEGRRLAELLAELGRRERTGVVTVQAEREIISIYLLAGEVVSADALNQTLEDGLGELVTERGLMSPEQYAGLAAEHQAGGGRVTDLLVERRFLSRTQLLEVLRLHNQRLCAQALAWTEGQYKFYSGDEVTYEEGILPIPVDELLGPSGGAPVDPEPASGSTPGAGTVFAPRHRLAGESTDFERLEREIGADAPAIFDRVDGRRTVSEIAAAVGCSEFKASYALSLFEAEGWVERTHEVAPEAAVPAPGLDDAALPEDPALEWEPVPARRRRRRWKIGWPRLGVSPKALPATLLPWSGRLLALAAVVALALLLAADPTGFLMPFRWQDELARLHDQDRLATSHLGLRQAADLFFVLHGRYPEDLTQLVDLELLSPEDLTDPRGRPFRYSATAVSYLVRSVAAGEPLPETGMSDSIAGNFLLDPDYAMGETSDHPPLVLLD